MITKVEIWRTDDGQDFNSEIEALRHDNEILRKEMAQLKWNINCQPSNSKYKDSYPPSITVASGITGCMAINKKTCFDPTRGYVKY